MAGGFAPIDGRNRQTRVESEDGAQASSRLNVRGIRRSPERMQTLGANLYAPAAPPLNPSRYAERPVVAAMQRPSGGARAKSPAKAPPPKAPALSAVHSYKDEVLTGAEYKKQWDSYAAKPQNQNYLEKLLRLVKPDLQIDKNFIADPLCIEKILHYCREIRVDAESGYPQIDACDRSLASKHRLSDCLKSLDKNKKYFLSSGKNSSVKDNALAQCFNGRWHFNQGDGWQAILHRDGRVTSQAKDFFCLEEKSPFTKAPIPWGTKFSDQSVEFYEVTEHRLNMLTDYFREFNQEGHAAAEKYLHHQYGVDDAQRQRELYKLFEAKDVPGILTKDQKIPDMNAERCLYSLMPEMEFYEPAQYNNANVVELFDALLISQGSLTKRVGRNKELVMIDPEEVLLDLEFTMSDEQREQALQRLNPQHRYIMRLGQTKHAPKYVVIFFENGIWHYRYDLNDKTPFCDTQGKLTQAAKDFILQTSGPTELQLVKATQERLRLMDSYLRDYRYHSPQAAMQNLLKTLPEEKQNDSLCLTGPIEYYQGYPRNYRGLHKPICSNRHFLRPDTKHRWLPKGVTSADHFAPRDPFSYPGTDRYLGVPNACVDESIGFLSYMYGVPAATYDISEFHRRNPITLDVNNVIALSEQVDGLVEPFDTDIGSVSIFDQGFSEQGALAWLEGLDRRLPYIFCSANWAGNVGHTMVLFFHRGSWYVYNSLDNNPNSARLEPSIKKVTKPRFIDGEFVGEELTDYGRENFYDPKAVWGIKGERLISYSPVDYTRLRVIRAKLNAARMVENEDEIDSEFFRNRAEFIRTWLDYDESQLQ